MALSQDLKGRAGSRSHIVIAQHLGVNLIDRRFIPAGGRNVAFEIIGNDPLRESAEEGESAGERSSSPSSETRLASAKVWLEAPEMATNTRAS